MGIEFPIQLLDQEEIWIDTHGGKHKINQLDKEECLTALDYILANARILRATWSMKYQKSYDEKVRARRWMLDRPAASALMHQIVFLEELEDV
jgi:hypothetical protein